MVYTRKNNTTQEKNAIHTKDIKGFAKALKKCFKVVVVGVLLGGTTF